jgi:hypothetical protein
LDKILVHGRHRADPEARWSETAANGERKRSVAEAAVRFAERVTSDLEISKIEILNYLKQFCRAKLRRAGNFVWMHQHMDVLMGLERGAQRTHHTDKRNLKYLEACKRLGELENEEIIEAAGVGEEATATEKWQP